MADDTYKIYTVPDQTDVNNPPVQGTQNNIFSTSSTGSPGIPADTTASDATTIDDGQVKLTQGTLQSGNFSTGVQGWQLKPNGNLEANNGNFRGDITGATGTFSGTVNVGSLNIPDITTASSFHVDSSGNGWWGANVASGISNAAASVTAAGLATFKNVLVGGSTIQYTLNDNGMQSFGDGSDGAATFDGSATPSGSSKSGSDYTLTRDVYYTSITISTGCTLNPSGYRIFGTGTLLMNGTAIIKRNGVNGSVGSDGVGSAGGAGGSGGTALADGYLKGSVAGGNGGAGGSSAASGSAGSSGANTSNSIGLNGAAGGNGNPSGGGSGGSGGTATTSNVKLIANWHLATLLDISSTGSTIKFDNSAAAGGGGGGGGSDGGGGGGGGGSAGGIVAIYVRNISIGASASITANGGNGGNGGSGLLGLRGGGGGGGGNGGQIILVYNTLSNSGSITVTAGTGGTGGNAGGGQQGSTGTSGSAGTIRQFQLSL